MKTSFFVLFFDEVPFSFIRSIRIGLIYLISGIGGNLFCGLFDPLTPQVCARVNSQTIFNFATPCTHNLSLKT